MRIINMMRAAAAMLCLVAICSIARADDAKEIAALYAKVDKAMVGKDVKGIMSAGVQGFTYTEAGRTMTGDQIIAQMQQEFQVTVGKPVSKTTIVTCKIKGTTASVTTTGYAELSMNLPDGKVHKMTSVTKTSDTLVKTAKGWFVKNINVTSNKLTLDGKPFDPNKPPPAG